MTKLFRCTVLVSAACAAIASATSIRAADAPAQPDGRPALVVNADPKPPVAPAGWKVETVLMAPQIESPSVVCALPDGRVLIGEDPLDNRGGKDPIDRIMCLHPDGKLTVWADKLLPVFGLAYLDGKVFVHQYPTLSVYDDVDSRGVNRKDLINQTGKPTIGGLNDHIPAQIRYAMDGYFYMAVGDRGVWGAKSNVDGSTAELAGGGLLRFRPDGTKLEVYSTGTRNHLDVSMTAEDEKFTYDNTDDGHGWWTRFTHMVDGGYYGYPWDYKAPENKNDPNSRKAPKEGFADKPFQPYTLWRMAEYGGGSPCGAVGYTEDALPPEFRDNLFHCDWGKGKVQRFVVERAGATFAVKEMTDFLTPGGDLRPLGIDTTADGTGFWVTDWGYGGWHQKKPLVGRLIKVTWTGKSMATPKPAWFLPAATGKKFDATTAELIEGLKHPAKSVRMVAQRRLAERLAAPATTKDATDAVIGLLMDNAASPHSKWHAFWASREMPRNPERGRVLRLANDFGSYFREADASVRRQALKLIGELAAAEGALIYAALRAEDPSVRFAAATALGRPGTAKAFGQGRSDGTVFVLQETLTFDDLDLHGRFAVFTALNRIGRAEPASWPVIVAGMEHKSEVVRANTAYALRNTYDEALVAALAKLATDKAKPAAARTAALLSLAELHRQPKAWGGQWWGTQPVGNPRPPKVVEWGGTTTVLATIRNLAKDDGAAVRSAAVKAMTIAPDPAAVDLLVELFEKNPDAATRQLVLQALAPSKSPKAAALATAVLKDAKTPAALVPAAIAVVREAGEKDAVPALVSLVESAGPDVVEPAMDALGSLKAAAAIPAIAKKLTATEPQIWNGAVNALQSINDKPSIDALVGALLDKRPDVRKNAVVALGQMKARDAIPAIVEGMEKKRLGGEGMAALARMPDVRAIDVLLGGLSDKNRGNVREARSAIDRIKAEALPLIEQRLVAGKIKPEALLVLQEIYGTYKPVQNWSIVGPFTPGKPLPFDPAALPKAEGSVKTADGATLTWAKVKAGEAGKVDVGKETPAAGDADAYLFATVDSPADREVSMQFGSDDGHTVWVNGKQVDDDRNNSSWAADESTAKVSLKKGKNVIVARAGNKGGTWEFSAAVAAERTGKLFDAKVAPPPAGTPKPPTREEYAAFAAAHKGEPAKGKAVFARETTACLKCHQAVQNEGGLIGPSLVGVGSKYDRAKLVESVLFPSKQIFDGFQQTVIKTKDDDVISGVVKSETETEIELYDASATRVVVKKADVKTRRHSEVSAMPEGLESALTPQEFADLIGYVESLKEGGAVPPKK